MQKPGFHLQSLQLHTLFLFVHILKGLTVLVYLFFFFFALKHCSLEKMLFGTKCTDPAWADKIPTPLHEQLAACPGTSLRVCVCVLSHAWLFATPWSVAHQLPLSMGCSRQEYWSGGCHFLLQRIFPTQDQTCISCIFCFACRFFSTEPLRKWGGIQGKQKVLAIHPLPSYLSSLNFSLELLLSGKLSPSLPLIF